MDLPDHWEVLPSDIEIGEILGEGACGKVYVATVKGICFSSNVPMSSMPSFGVGIPKPSQNITKDMTVKAAVKMLPSKYKKEKKANKVDSPVRRHFLNPTSFCFAVLKQFVVG